MNWKGSITALASLALTTACQPEPAREKAAADQPALAAVGTPDPAACPPPEHAYDPDEMGERTDPLVVPASIAAIAATDNTNLAVTTLGGGQICQDVSWLYNLGKDAATFAAGRFIAVEWGAFEAFGTMMFDRAGKGAQVETGNAPAFSPSGKRVAALQFTNSGFGGLENFMIWQVEAQGLKQVFALPEQTYLSWIEQGFDDFQIDRWQSETCLAIMAFANADLELAEWDRAKATPTLFYAAEADGWDIRPGSCP
jgi:hypothetical protein